MSVLDRPYFHDEAAAFEKLEALLWPHGAVCPHCGGMEKAYKIATNAAKRVRLGLWKCGHCRKQFTVKVGTVFESSHVALHKWFQAVYLLASSKKGISSNQLARTLDVTVKTAWFMSHRIREAMRSGDLSPMGGAGGIVEVDETFIGRKKGAEVRHGYEHKFKVLSLVDRATGRARSMVVDKLNTKTVQPIVRQNIASEARLMTDEARHYTIVGREFADHQVVRHAIGEYGRGEFHTNTIEGFFSIFKRGMKGIYQHCGEKHLHRYLAEFDFRYNNRVALGVNDETRTNRIISSIVGRRLMYRDSLAASVAN